MDDISAGTVRICTHCGTQSKPGDSACEVCTGEKFLFRCLRCHKDLEGPACPDCWAKLPAGQRFLHHAASAWQAGLAAVQWLLREARVVAVETFRQSARLWRYGNLWLRCRLLGRATFHAQRALGRRMAEVGVGNEKYRERIASLDARLGALETARGAWGALAREREGLVLALAAEVLGSEAPPAPEVKDEHLQARAAHKALGRHHEETKTARATLFPSAQVGWSRPAIGYGAAGLFLLLLIRWLRG